MHFDGMTELPSRASLACSWAIVGVIIAGTFGLVLGLIPRSEATSETPPASPAILASEPERAAGCDRPEYDRRLYGRWLDLDGDCWDARHEALLAAAEPASTVVRTEPGRACRVVALALVDRYTGRRFVGQARKLDVDHIVPLAEAHESGAWRWDEARRQAFANDPLNLVPTAASVNRSKGARDPGGWLPPDRDAWCWYGRRWLSVKETYQLDFDVAEVRGLLRALERCGRPER